MISVQELYYINRYLVEEFGGMGVGFKDENLAESLVVQIYQEVFGKVLYPTVEDKISHIVFSIIANHIFLDGNKRTGASVLEKLCEDNNLNLSYTEDELIELVLLIAQSKVNREYIRDWILERKDRKFSVLRNSNIFK